MGLRKRVLGSSGGWLLRSRRATQRESHVTHIEVLLRIAWRPSSVVSARLVRGGASYFTCEHSRILALAMPRRNSFLMPSNGCGAGMRPRRTSDGSQSQILPTVVAGRV